MNYSQALSGAAIILGLFIMFSLYVNKTPVVKDFIVSRKGTQYHIGCYMADQNTTHYHDIKLKLQQLKHQSELKQYKSAAMTPLDYLDNKSVQVAKNVQDFLKQYNHYKNKMSVNEELLRAVKLAHHNFKACVNDVDTSFYSEKDCSLDWQTYLKCNNELDVFKRGMNVEFDFKYKVSEDIRGLLNKDPSKVASPRHPYEDFDKQFRRKDKQLQDKQKMIELQLKLLSGKTSEIQYLYSVAKNQTFNARQLYNDCFQHQHQYRLCEELSKQIRKLGHGSIDNLGEKVQKKANALAKMKQLIQNSAKDQNTAQMKKILQSNMKDFRKLYKFFWESKATILKKCGCNQAQFAKLKETLITKERQEQILRKQMLELQDKEQIKIRQLQQIRTLRRNLLQDLDIKLKKVKTHKREQNIDLIQILKKLQKQSDLHESNILDLQKKFEDLEGKCSRIKNRLAIHIGSISKVTDCLNKYKYYSQIKRKYEATNPKEIKMSDSLKTKLSKSLSDFRF